MALWKFGVLILLFVRPLFLEMTKSSLTWSLHLTLLPIVTSLISSPALVSTRSRMRKLVSTHSRSIMNCLQPSVLLIQWTLNLNKQVNLLIPTVPFTLAKLQQLPPAFITYLLFEPYPSFDRFTFFNGVCCHLHFLVGAGSHQPRLDLPETTSLRYGEVALKPIDRRKVILNNAQHASFPALPLPYFCTFVTLFSQMIHCISLRVETS